jgi:SAM-dependent methyltransferase
MEREEYARIAAVEDEHWWYHSTRRIARTLLTPWLRPEIRSLDAGCGPGGTGVWLGEFGSVIGADLSPEALHFVQRERPTTTPVHTSLTALPFTTASFDVTLATTVLYAIPDDDQAVAELARTLRPGGALLVIEPAFSMLRRAHDDVVHGQRRYRTGTLAALLVRHGMRIEHTTYAKSFLAPPAFTLGLVDRLRGARAPKQSDLESHGVDSAIDPVFERLAAAEDRRIARKRRIPFGTSAVVLATKR